MGYTRRNKHSVQAVHAVQPVQIVGVVHSASATSVLQWLKLLARLEPISLLMLSEKKGDEASAEIEHWANEVAQLADEKVRIQVYYDADSSTYVLRLMKGNRVLLFRLSEAQVQTAGREQECERTLKRKIKDLENLIWPSP